MLSFVVSLGFGFALKHSFLKEQIYRNEFTTERLPVKLSEKDIN